MVLTKIHVWELPAVLPVIIKYAASHSHTHAVWANQLSAFWKMRHLHNCPLTDVSIKLLHCTVRAFVRFTLPYTHTHTHTHTHTQSYVITFLYFRKELWPSFLPLDKWVMKMRDKKRMKTLVMAFAPSLPLVHKWILHPLLIISCTPWTDTHTHAAKINSLGLSEKYFLQSLALTEYSHPASSTQGHD